MNGKFRLLLFFIISLTGCKQQVNKEKGEANQEMEITGSQKKVSYITDWVNAINDNNLQSLEQVYSPNAIKVISEDNIINSSSQIVAYYETEKKSIKEIESLFNIEANKDRNIHYELIKYKTADQKEYIQLLIWRLEDKEVIREFEFTEESNTNTRDRVIKEIAGRRELWIELCNENKAEDLVNELYAPNTIYFNHKPIVQGVEAVIAEYDYMNNANYTLNLKPIHLEVANDDLAFEVGQCSGSYGGKYILVWKKQSNGDWKIFIDSNI